MRIAITRSRLVATYERWLPEEGDVKITVLDQSHDPGDLDAYDGFVFTGGEDIDPCYYSGPEAGRTLSKAGLNPRDEFEMRLLKSAMDRKIPILGICRGMHLVNVFLGGSLIQDIPTVGKMKHHRVDAREQFHTIEIRKGSMLYSIAHKTACLVNSSHHQAVDKIGTGLAATSYSDDGIIESMEWENPIHNGWMLLVQWHPERLDIDPELSWNLKNEFIRACSENSRLR